MLTLFFKNCNVLKLADIINVESCVFKNNCFNKDSFSIFNGNLILVSTTHSYMLDQLVMVYYLYDLQVSQIWEKMNYPFSYSYMESSSRQANSI